MNWYKTFQLENTGEKINPHWDDGMYYRMNIEDDTFIHFTTGKRAKEIMKTGVIKIDPPYTGYVRGVFAVSTTYGEWVPDVQITHIKKWMQFDQKDYSTIIAVHFMTNVKPTKAHVEEVVWDSDVPLLTSEIISVREAQKILQKNKSLTDDDAVYYHNNLKEYETYVNEIKKEVL